MGTWPTIFAVVLLAAATVSAGSRQQMAGRTLTEAEIAEPAKTMPEGPHRELTVRVCAAGHEPQRAASVRLTREGWEEVVAKMVGLGAKGTDEELAKVTAYLAENFKVERRAPQNATADAGRVPQFTFACQVVSSQLLSGSNPRLTTR